MPNESLRRLVTIAYLPFMQLDDPSIPWAHDAIGLPGRNDIPEQWIIDSEVLRTMIELVFSCPEARYTTTGKDTFFKYFDFGNESFKRRSAG